MPPSTKVVDGVVPIKSLHSVAFIHCTLMSRSANPTLKREREREAEEKANIKLSI